MGPKLTGGALVLAGLLVLLVSQMILTGFARIGWWVGLDLVILGGAMLLDG